MVYGELKGKALEWATDFVFGFQPNAMPSKIVISPFSVEQYCEDFQSLIASKGLKLEKIGNSFLVWKRNKQVLFGEGGIGASNFADSTYILCHCNSVEEIIFVGTGGGIGEHVESADINIPTSCIRLTRSWKYSYA